MIYVPKRGPRAYNARAVALSRSENKSLIDPPPTAIGALPDIVRVSPVALRLGSEMDPCRRDLPNLLLSYLVSDSFGPVLGARA